MTARRATKNPKRASEEEVSLSGALAAAADELERGRPERALPHLLAAWGRSRSEVIAALVERASQQVKRVALGRGTLKAMTARWHEIAEKGDPGDIPRLLAALTSGQAVAATGRVAALAKRPDDPRVARALIGLYAAPPYFEGAAATKLMSAVRALLERTADPRVVDALERVGTPLASEAALAVRASVESRFPARALVAPAEVEALARVEACLARVRSGEALLDAVYADLAADEPRAVYADWLLERGDPRGEFISLQLAHARGVTSAETVAREKELLERFGRAWSGPAATVTHASGRTFRRGFLAGCTLDPPNTRTWRAVSGAKEWATVEELSLSTFADLSAALLRSPPYRSVRSVDGVSPALAEELATAQPPLPLELLGISFTEEQIPSLASALSDGRGLPACRVLALRSTLVPLDAARLLRGAFGASLARLEVIATVPALPDWLAAITPTQLGALAVTGSMPLELTRGGAGAPWTLAITSARWPSWYPWGTRGAGELGEVLRAVGAGIARVRVPAAMDARSRETLEPAFAGYAGVVEWTS